MINPANHLFFNHLDAPKRFIGLTFDEAALAALGLLVLLMASQAVLALMPVALAFAVLKRLKKGRHPRVLLLLAWWYLPQSLTQFFVAGSPASHHRLWNAWEVA